MTAADRLRRELQVDTAPAAKLRRADGQVAPISFALQSVSASGQLVLPISVRRSFGIENGGYVEFLVPPEHRGFSQQLSVVRRKALRNTPEYATPGGNWTPYKVAANGQLTLPAALRREWSLRRGGDVEMAVIDDKVVIAPRGGTDRLAADWIGSRDSDGDPDLTILERAGSSEIVLPGALLWMYLCGQIPPSSRSLIAIASEADMAIRELVTLTGTQPTIRELVTRSEKRQMPAPMRYLANVGAGIGLWEWQILILSLTRPASVHRGVDLRIQIGGADAVIRAMRFSRKHQESVAGGRASAAVLSQAAFAMAVGDECDASVMIPTSWLDVIPPTAFAQFGLHVSNGDVQDAVPPAESGPRKRSLRQFAAFLVAPNRRPLKIDDDLLESLGLGDLSVDDRNALRRSIYEALEMRVGQTLANRMTEDQLEEFERFFEAKDDAGAFDWLTRNFPDYQDIVAVEFAEVKHDVAAQVVEIRRAAVAD